MFCRYDLRTTDPDAARRFYADVVGLDLEPGPSAGESAIVAAWPLHEQARARGAPAHWLGHLAVSDVEAAAARLVEQGAERLGPSLRAPNGAAYAALRDPLGAVVAVRESVRATRPGPVAWHQLHTRDVDRAWAVYGDLFGWTPTETVVVEGAGEHRLFAWDGTGAPVGSIAATANLPGVHVHWLYYFAVADIEAATAKVLANGGTVAGPGWVLPAGDRFAACEDAQGAAFGLHQAG